MIVAGEGFTGADLKRVVEDAKGLLAFDRSLGTHELEANAYLLRAVEAVALNKRRYAEAEAGARSKIKPAPNFADLLAVSGHMLGGSVAFTSD